MPSLPPAEEPPAGPAERISTAVRRAVMPSDVWVTVRMLVACVVLGISAAAAPFPWPLIAAIALVILVFDVARMSNRR